MRHGMKENELIVIQYQERAEKFQVLLCKLKDTSCTLDNPVC